MTQQSKHRPSTPRQAAARASPLDRALDPDLFKSLSDPTRLRLLACLAKCARMCSVTEIAECCSVDFSVVSRHLSMLAGAGVLESRKAGRTVLYQVQYKRLCDSLRALADAIEHCCPDGSCCAGDGQSDADHEPFPVE